MSDALKWLEAIKKKQLSYHEDRIKVVMTSEVPQHILATKEVADKLARGDEGYARTEAGFFFKERLVNRLMYLAYLHGRNDIDSRSFEAGRDKALKLMKLKLDEI